MHDVVSGFLERYALHRAVQSALASGIGLYRGSWCPGGRGERELASDVLRWCRVTLSQTHRPCGVESVSLALVVRDDNRTLATARFPILRPADFAGAALLESAARDVLQTWLGQGMFARRGVRLTSLLFSWGDLAQELDRTG